MKLLFDENLRPRLAQRVARTYPGSSHVLSEELGNASDARIWDFAAIHDFCIVSKDTDFRALSVLRGAPPKVIWLSVGNSGTRQIEALLIATADIVLEFLDHPDENMLVLRS